MNSSKIPSQVLIIRHGEKIGDPKKDDDGGCHLSIRGSARAAALPALFVAAMPQLGCKLREQENDFVGEYRTVPVKGSPPRFATPDFIFATERSKNSNRPIETATPLATALHLPINAQYGDNDGDIKTMTGAILNEVAFAGKVVLICWHHGKIPAVAQALGVSGAPKWDGKVFDRVWRITFPKGKAKLEDLPQMLLFGDAAK